MKFSIFDIEKILYILHGQVFVMSCYTCKTPGKAKVPDTTQPMTKLLSHTYWVIPCRFQTITQSRHAVASGKHVRVRYTP